MKKLMVAILVMAAASVFAGNGNGHGNGNGNGNGNDNGQVSETIQTALENVRFDPATGAFNIQKGGDWVIQLYQPETDNGNTDKFGYYKIVNGVKSEAIPLANKPKGNESFTISGLNAGDSIVFYVDPKNNGNSQNAVLNDKGELAGQFVVMNASGDTSAFVADADTVYGIAWPTNNNLSFKYAGFTVVHPSEPAPSGQPLPGALTTMLVAGGCAAFLRKRKAARK